MSDPVAVAQQIADIKGQKTLKEPAKREPAKTPCFSPCPHTGCVDIPSSRAQTNELLFRAGDSTAVEEACKRSPVGKLLPDDLYVHRTALNHLEPLLRVYEGCGRAYLGDIEDANVVKIHRRSGKLSYLAYPDFETDPHPALARCVRLSLRTRQIDATDCSASVNPPVLHRKEAFLHPEHPLYEKFARLTRQEEERGLLNETATIGTRRGWQARLGEHGRRLHGHRLVRRSAKH